MMQAVWKGFILVGFRLVNTIPLPKIAGGPLQNLRASGLGPASVDGVWQREKALFAYSRPNIERLTFLLLGVTM